MAEPLTGAELRVFRSLVREHDRDTLEAIRIELTQAPEVALPAIEDALASLIERGRVEEFEPGRYRVSPAGWAVRRTLLGEPLDSD